MNSLNKAAIKTIGISGAYGYVGTFLCDFFKTYGYNVIKFTHNKQRHSKDYYMDLSNPVKGKPMPQLDYFIHCGWDMRLVKWKDIKNINIDGSITLLQTVRKICKGPIFFMSSSAAFEEAKSNYGKAKYIVEQFCLVNQIIVIRPGLIYDDHPKGILGALSTLSNKTPLLPRIWPKTLSLHMCFLPDIAKNIHELIINESVSQNNQNLYIFAHCKAILFETIIRKFASRKQIIFIYFPWQIIWILIKFLEYIGLKLRLKSDSLISLRHQNKNLFANYNEPKLINFKSFNFKT